MQVQRARQCAGHLAAVRQGRQVDPDAAAWPARSRGARQAGLADPRWADQRNAATALQQGFEIGEIAISPDQRGSLAFAPQRLPTHETPGVFDRRLAACCGRSFEVS